MGLSGETLEILVAVYGGGVGGWCHFTSPHFGFRRGRLGWAVLVSTVVLANAGGEVIVMLCSGRQEGGWGW